MNRANRLLGAVLLFLCVLVPAEGIHAISPPRPAGSDILDAACTDPGGRVVVLRRVRLLTDDPAERIQFMTTSGAIARFRLSEIRRIELPGTPPGADGFAAASTVLRAPDVRVTAIRLVSAVGPLRVTGFTDRKERVEIRLADCRVLVIEIVGAAAVPGAPASATVR